MHTLHVFDSTPSVHIIKVNYENSVTTEFCPILFTFTSIVIANNEATKTKQSLT